MRTIRHTKVNHIMANEHNGITEIIILTKNDMVRVWVSFGFKIE